MSHNEDYLYALRLQAELDALEGNEIDEVAELPVIKTSNKRKNDELDLNATRNLVHPDLETIDPAPDIFSMFGKFDLRFFQGKLKCVELEWSKRMYQCAGICYHRRNSMGTSITIRLSEPLLKLRSRRDLIETMLHEMIHAYLFIQKVFESNGGHGPNFKKMMENLNKVAGTKISVYHTFLDEVEVYKTHVWRCNGICQHRKPFFGWIKRTSNRAPGPNDNWWAKHQETCTGTFVKMSEPEPKSKAKRTKKDDKNTNSIVKPKNVSNVPYSQTPPRKPVGGATKMNGGGTIVLKPTTKKPTVITLDDDADSGSVLSSVSDKSAGGHLRNVVGFADLTRSGSPARPTFSSSGGRVLGSASNQSSNGNLTENVRNVWANKFNDKKLDNAATIEIIDIDTNNNRSPDIQIVEPKQSRIKKEPESRISIFSELLNDLGEDDANVIMIDDEFDDTFTETENLANDTSVADKLFSSDTLIEDFNNINNVIMNDPENFGNKNMEIVTCPICEDQMERGELSSHLDGCNGITVQIKPKHPGAKKRPKQPLPFYKSTPSTSQSTITHEEQELLRRAGYTQVAIERLSAENKEAKEYNDRIMDEMATDRRKKFTTGRRSPVETIVLGDGDRAGRENRDGRGNEPGSEKHACPICNVEIDLDQINEHLDECLG